MLDVVGEKLTAPERELLSRPVVGGVVLFARNYSSIEQLQQLVSSIRACNPSLLIAVDQEGGRVQRFQKGFVKLPAYYEIGRRYQSNPQQGLEFAKQCGWLMASELLSCDLDFSFAPVLDIYDSNSKVIASRAFDSAPEVVADLALQLINGMHDAGMASTGKHFPGHGTVVADSHHELPVDERSYELIAETDLQVFKHCSQSLDAIMPAHVVYPSVDKVCAGFSSIWIQQILREDLAFEGVIFSDDLSMAAAHSVGGVQQRAELALQAGCDMLLLCNDPAQALELADYLESVNYPLSEKLLTMAARKKIDRVQLLASATWLEAKAAIEAIDSRH